MGTGNFFGMVPDSMKDTALYGVELDSITGRIAKQLYPQAHITVDGFERVNFADNRFDLAVGNVPFGNYQIADARYDKQHFFIHDYFFGKTLDKVRPGGIVAFITSKGTLDKPNTAVREYLAERADLLGAVRLPDNAFKNAGTEVTSDIIFLQKRAAPPEQIPDWVDVSQTADGVPVNKYFEQHPEMVLGSMVWESGPYGQETACKPLPDADLKEQLAAAVANLSAPDKALLMQEAAAPEQNAETLDAPAEVRNFSYTEANGKLYYKEDGGLIPVEVPAATEERIRGMIALRDITRNLIETQLNGGSDAQIAQLQTRLNSAYDSFTAKWGLLNSTGNKRAFEQDSSYCLLCSLEVLDEDRNLERKADMFSKRTINQEKRIDHVDTPVEALAVSIGERAWVDLSFMAEILDRPGEELEIAKELSGVIFKNPEKGLDHPLGGWENADEYLSGNVRKKLAGQDIIITKWIGLEGTADLAARNQEGLLTRYPAYLVEEAAAFDRYYSILPEAATAVKSGGCTMHDVSEGGVFAALWEMAEGAGVGLTIDMKKLPLRQETVEVCEFCNVNPYELRSGGSLIIEPARTSSPSPPTCPGTPPDRRRCPSTWHREWTRTSRRPADGTHRSSSSWP